MIKRAKMAVRFQELTEDEMQECLEESTPTNTQRQTQWSISIFKDWLNKRHPDEVLEDMDAEILALRLKKFYLELKVDKDKDYSRSAHLCIRAGINRYLASEQVGKNFSIVTDPIFKVANKKLNAKLKRIRDRGTNNVQHHPSILPEDIAKCYESGVFGGDSPISLLRVNWFNISLFFCKRGREIQRQLKKTSFVIKKDALDREYVEMSEEEKKKSSRCSEVSEKANEGDPKMFSTGQRHCPVEYFKKLLSVLNPGEEALFQRSKRIFDITDEVWFERAPLGVNTIGKMMREISIVAKLSQIYTNHSVRATSVTLLDKAGIPIDGIMQMSGHRCKASVKEFCERQTLAQHCSEVLSAATFSSTALPDGSVLQRPSERAGSKTRSKASFGVDPVYSSVNTGYKEFHYDQPFYFQYNKGVIPKMTIAYETWGTLNEDKSNVILLCTGLSPSSHARSHKDNTSEGWWEKFIGPGCALDTDKFYIVCCNVLGGCYGSSGPSSINPLTNQPYATTFPIVSVQDIVKSQFLLLDSLGIDKLHAAVGSSLGGMLSLTAACLYPDRVNRVVSISACVQSHPASIAMRYVQRRILMSDPNWNKGFYYNSGAFPRLGMKHAREVGTITYRSGPEWEERFGRKRIDDQTVVEPNFCPEFEIESYLDYQGDSFCVKYDPNSLLYISKAMDLFDLGEGFDSLLDGVSRVKCPTLVLGVQSDVLFPIKQQREMEKLLKESGNNSVTFYELNSIYGHDTFLLDVVAVGAAVKGHLETDLKVNSNVRKDKR